MTRPNFNTGIMIGFVEDGVDEFGTERNAVGVSCGDLVATHTSFRRGGCLYAGFAYLRNVRTGAHKEVDLTSRASDTPEHVRYLIGLAEKHVG